MRAHFLAFLFLTSGCNLFGGTVECAEDELPTIDGRCLQIAPDPTLDAGARDAPPAPDGGSTDQGHPDISIIEAPDAGSMGSDACVGTDNCVPEVVLLTSSTAAAWSPVNIVNTGGPLTWEVTGGVSIAPQTVETPVFDLSTNTGTARISIRSASKLRGLEELSLQSLDITDIDIRSAPNLLKIDLFDSAVTTVDLSRNTRLRDIWIEHSALVDLDISAATEATFIALERNQLTRIALDQNTKLTRVWLQYNRLGSDAMDDVVVTLERHGLLDGELKLSDNPGSLTAESSQAYEALVARGWAIDVPAP